MRGLSQTTILKWIHPGDDLTDAYSVRRLVFIEEQGVPEDIEIDDIDPITDHVVLYENTGPIATGRIVHDNGQVSLGRIAVLPSHRGLGYGARVVQLLTDKAFTQGASEVHLHSQTHALAFYEKLGFEPYGDIYEEAGIPHQSMRKIKP